MSAGRRASDHGAEVLRGALHDVGHDLATLTYLVEAVRTDHALPSSSRARVELVERELERLSEIVRRAMSWEAHAVLVDVRPMLEQLVAVYAVGRRTRLELSPGPDAKLCADSTMLWRILSNLVQNALRAAGADGQVEVAIVAQEPPTIAITDNGPGLGATRHPEPAATHPEPAATHHPGLRRSATDGPAPRSSGFIGLDVVARLAKACGAQLRFAPRKPAGTRVELAFPAPPPGDSVA